MLACLIWPSTQHVVVAAVDLNFATRAVRGVDGGRLAVTMCTPFKFMTPSLTIPATTIETVPQR